MQWLKAVDDFENSVDQFLAFVIAEAAQHHAAAQVRVVIGIASRTAQWALASNLN
jgi:hypothetical protein